MACHEHAGGAGAFWCEPKTDGGKVKPTCDCLYKTNTRMDVAGGLPGLLEGLRHLKRFYADEHYNNRDHCGGRFQQRNITACDGEVCDGQLVLLLNCFNLYFILFSSSSSSSSFLRKRRSGGYR